MIGLVVIVIPRRMAAELGFLRTKEIPLLPLSLGCYEDHKVMCTKVLHTWKSTLQCYFINSNNCLLQSL